MNEFSNIRYALRHIFSKNSLSHAYARTRPSLCRRALSHLTQPQEYGSRKGGSPLPHVSPLYPLTDSRPRFIAPPTLALGPGSGPGPTACGRRRLG